ncbi:Gfo/Idh/MocA family oxidoreductase [Pseudanabaena sp. FACHB-2040]|uniref:Gfo/Idh/MocA family protein n=1 Tax=Pseudanabaena sp. FACHB-2040 TaxID=2692859 RepID=UPI0016899273|nr:Gfo/Idh/MocA family oxidoreductase [Pseudanabaena sp. FACHB-2040]MBD2256159.1 Gfo/Idh/MocA family oxidoreductase [Pseudanabaena sp. FACHB-2040]
MLQVGLVGTGFAARLRAEAFTAETRSQLIAVAGHSLERTAQFCEPFGVQPCASWQEVVNRPELDLIVVSTVSQSHGDIVEAALLADKHVVVEYPLSLDVAQAVRLLALACDRNRLLHIEHIELLGGQHQAARAHLAAVGQPFYARYCTLNPQRPAPQKWTYQPDQFGFPLMGALSRIHRLTDLFGTVEHVFCQNRYEGTWPDGSGYTSCLCTAQLHFTSGLVAEVTYGKGEAVWTTTRRLEIHGSQGGLTLDGDQATLVTAAGEQPIEIGSRRGLFAKDTAQVLDFLAEETPLYVSPQASLYALQVADAARQSAESGQAVAVETAAE